MARLIKHEAHDPYVVPAEDLKRKAAIYLCACGLSKNKPYCDGSHASTADEEPGKTYRYAGDVRDGDRTAL